jgi:hypothetical protein
MLNALFRQIIRKLVQITTKYVISSSLDGASTPKKKANNNVAKAPNTINCR